MKINAWDTYANKILIHNTSSINNREYQRHISTTSFKIEDLYRRKICDGHNIVLLMGTHVKRKENSDFNETKDQLPEFQMSKHITE